MIISSAPSAPAFLRYIIIPPSKFHSPRIHLTWTEPVLKNGKIRNYLVFFNQSEEPHRVHRETFRADTFNYSIDVLGGASYHFHVRAVTIKPGLNASSFVKIPEYGKGCCLKDYLKEIA